MYARIFLACKLLQNYYTHTLCLIDVEYEHDKQLIDIVVISRDLNGEQKLIGTTET